MAVAVKKAWTRHEFTTDHDISSAEFWARPFDEREKTFAKLRAEGEVSFHPPVEIPVAHEEEGFWAITKAADLQEASRMNDVFLSGYGLHVDPYPWDGSAASFFHTQDGILHQRNRGLVSSAFTPKQVKRMVDHIHDEARKIVDTVADGGDFDFAEDISAKLPAMIGARLLGVPDSEIEAFQRSAGALIGKADPELGDPKDPLKAFRESRNYVEQLGRDLAEQRRRKPEDDLITNLVQAEIDGRRLTDDDIGGFAYLMTIASNDTTKQTTTLSMMALDKFPEQKEWLLEDYNGRIRSATTEFLRYANPVIHHARTAAHDIEWKGREIRKGDKLALFYCSANRDEDLYESPTVFDLSRQGNSHVSFGGGGVHFCLGNRFATTMLQALFDQLLHRVEVEVVGEPEYLASNLIHGVRHLPVHITSK